MDLNVFAKINGMSTLKLNSIHPSVFEQTTNISFHSGGVARYSIPRLLRSISGVKAVLDLPSPNRLSCQ